MQVDPVRKLDVPLEVGRGEFGLGLWFDRIGWWTRFPISQVASPFCCDPDLVEDAWRAAIDRSDRPLCLGGRLITNLSFDRPG